MNKPWDIPKWLIALMIVLAAPLGIHLSRLATAASENTVRGKNPLVVNTAITQNVESCYGFTGDTVGFDFHSRGGTATKIAFTSGLSGTTYFTVPAGSAWSADATFLRNAEQICFQNGAATDTIELIAWR